MHSKKILEILKHSDEIEFEAGTKQDCILHYRNCNKNKSGSINVPVEMMKEQMRIMFEVDAMKTIDLAWDIHVKRFEAGFIDGGHYENIS